jgi:hypothetical protein
MPPGGCWGLTCTFSSSYDHNSSFRKGRCVAVKDKAEARRRGAKKSTTRANILKATTGAWARRSWFFLGKLFRRIPVYRSKTGSRVRVKGNASTRARSSRCNCIIRGVLRTPLSPPREVVETIFGIVPVPFQLSTQSHYRAPRTYEAHAS